MKNVLAEIVEHKRKEVSRLVIDREPERSDRDFEASLRMTPRAIIAEIKHTSPSEGVLAGEFDPARQAKKYETGGASAISVLTNKKYFDGSPEHLRAVRQAVNVPVLRKDFIIDVKQVDEARLMGADACLLIVAALSHRPLGELMARAIELSMTPLIEVHTESELEIAHSCGARVIAINNRDLRDLSIDPTTTERLCERVRDDALVISASGIRHPSEVAALPQRVGGVLIGTALMKCDEPVAFLRSARKSMETAS